MARFNGAFVDHLVRLEERYNDDDARHEEIFRSSMAVREALVSQVREGHMDALRAEQEARTKTGEWNTAARRTILLEGRQNYKDVCASLDALLTDQFNTILNTQEAEFLAAERRRDELVRKELGNVQGASGPALPKTPGADVPKMTSRGIPPPRTHSMSRSRFLYPSTISSPHNVALPPPQTNSISYVPQSPKTPGADVPEMTSREIPSLRTHPMSRSSPHGVALLPPQTNSISYVPESTGTRDTTSRDTLGIHEAIGSSRSASSDASQPRSQTADVSSSLPEPHTKISTSLSLPEGSSRTINQGSVRTVEDVFIKEFVATQQQRQSTFLREEKRWERQFQASEAERENAEHERNKAFDLKVDDWSKRFQKLLESHEGRFQSREEARSEWNTLLNAAFESAQEQVSREFIVSLSLIKQQAEVEEEYENLMSKRVRVATIVLYRRQQQKALDDRRKRFMAAQRCRDDELGVDPRGYEPRPLPSISCPMPARISGRPPPSSGFAPSILFQGSGTRKALPVPAQFEDTNAQPINVPRELTLVNLQEWHQGVFETSEARRADLFERETQRRHQMFKANEVKRVAGFLKGQRTRARAFKYAEDHREAAFQEAKHRRERLFQAAERTREADFGRGEAVKEAQFRRAQEERVQQFQATQLELQNQCFDNDKRRWRELEEWRESLLEKREQELAMLFKSEQEEFEFVLQSRLARSYRIPELERHFIELFRAHDARKKAVLRPITALPTPAPPPAPPAQKGASNLNPVVYVNAAEDERTSYTEITRVLRPDLPCVRLAWIRRGRTPSCSPSPTPPTAPTALKETTKSVDGTEGVPVKLEGALQLEEVEGWGVVGCGDVGLGVDGNGNGDGDGDGDGLEDAPAPSSMQVRFDERVDIVSGPFPVDCIAGLNPPSLATTALDDDKPAALDPVITPAIEIEDLVAVIDTPAPPPASATESTTLPPP
ncbi:hypothetical protein DXG01_009097 [Tephrocybe rancida]|nr:hypothetical protein DXG01_009097 [Tephrocybe rancida]